MGVERREERDDGSVPVSDAADAPTIGPGVPATAAFSWLLSR
jgi:hypothetical protein